MWSRHTQGRPPGSHLTAQFSPAAGVLAEGSARGDGEERDAQRTLAPRGENRDMSISGDIPPWPTSDPEHGRIRPRTFTNLDAGMAMDLSQDPYVPTVGSLPPHATPEEALAWIERQRQRHVEGTGFSFSIADLKTDRSMGNIGLWLEELGAGRAQLGYAVAPNERGHSIASDAFGALTTFAWTIAHLHRLEFYIEPWNAASIRTAERAGYEREGLLRSHQESARRSSHHFSRHRRIRLLGIRRRCRRCFGGGSWPRCPQSDPDDLCLPGRAARRRP
ncbi:hypothetical protein BJG92_02960 [Arthrobacter sp. SO5]|uniref:GNAT family N-acetyltransferase n=1 Tax=Arthrobacter sp. SO5 TaxID=1897055 RepID=UPI0027DF3C14|nr:GNAT family N-acetyltransferase [Arthrobacter sp. SO5]MCB5275412.1 hypothetical protein [Arthrobacter sp. SO5]